MKEIVKELRSPNSDLRKPALEYYHPERWEKLQRSLFPEHYRSAVLPIDREALNRRLEKSYTEALKPAYPSIVNPKASEIVGDSTLPVGVGLYQYASIGVIKVARLTGLLEKNPAPEKVTGF